MQTLFFFFVVVTTYNIRSHSYITTDAISHNDNGVEPLYSKDSTALIQCLMLGRLRPQLASLDAWSWNR